MHHLDLDPHRPPPRPTPVDWVGRPQLVIADDGANVELLVLPWSRRRAIGEPFEHRGRWWTITGCRPGGRTLVAEPLGH